MKTKGQIRMTETIAILIIFFIIIVIAFVFYVQFQRGTIEEKKVEIAGERSISIALETLFLPELRCNQGDNVQTEDCIDIYKLEVAQERILANQDYYFDFLGHAKITVEEIYPGNEVWELYDLPRQDRSNIRTFVPVALLHPVTQKFRYGVLTIDVYS